MKIKILLIMFLYSVFNVSAGNIRYSGMVGGGMFKYREWESEAADNGGVTVYKDEYAAAGLVTSHGILIKDVFYSGASLKITDEDLLFYVDGEYRFLRGRTLRPYTGIQVYPVLLDIRRHSADLRLRAGVRKTLWGNFHVLGEVSMSNSLGVLVGIGI
jgi:hypothetical protein